MKSSVTLKERELVRDTLASFLIHVKQRVDPRNLRNIKEFTIGLSIKGVLRLKDISWVCVQAKGGFIKSYINRFSYLLNEARFDAHRLFSDSARKALGDLLKEKKIKLLSGKVVLVVDPTYYYKRSRGRKKGMEHISRVKPPKKGAGPKPGYTDIFSSIVLKKNKGFPLTRKLSLPSEPGFLSEKIIIEEVIEESVQKIKEIGLEAIITADRGVASKRLAVKYKGEKQDFVFRMREVNVKYKDKERNILKIARSLPSLGKVAWKEKKRRKETSFPGVVKAFPAELTYYGKKKAILNWVIVFPLRKGKDPLILATTLPIESFPKIAEVVKIYEMRWTIETMFEYLKRGWGINKFMVRTKKAIERVLILCVLAFMALMLTRYLQSRINQRFIHSAGKLLHRFSVLRKEVTIGKLREAIELDFQSQPREWVSFL